MARKFFSIIGKQAFLLRATRSCPTPKGQSDGLFWMANVLLGEEARQILAMMEGMNMASILETAQ